MDRPFTGCGRMPFVLATADIAELNKRAARSDHPVARLVLLTTLIPCEAFALASADVRNFDEVDDVIELAGPAGAPTRIALGHAAAATVRNAIDGRCKGRLFGDEHGAPILPDGFTVDYANEMFGDEGGGPLPFAWTFRSLREGVFAAMADGGIPQNVTEAVAGLRHTAPECFPDILDRIQQRAASDWWAATLGIPFPATIEVLRGCLKSLRSDDRGDDSRGDRNEPS